MSSMRFTRAALRSFKATPIARPSTAVVRSYATASGHEAHKPSSEVPWIVISALVWIPTIFYLTTPSSTPHATHADHSHDDAHAAEDEAHIEVESAPAEFVEEVVEEVPAIEELKEIVAAPEVIEAVEVKGEEQAQVEIEAVVADNAAGDDVTELIKEAEAAVAAV